MTVQNEINSPNNVFTKAKRHIFRLPSLNLIYFLGISLNSSEITLLYVLYLGEWMKWDQNKEILTQRKLNKNYQLQKRIVDGKVLKRPQRKGKWIN